MGGDGNDPKRENSSKEAKLAQALRANLRRRKGAPVQKPPKTDEDS